MDYVAPTLVSIVSLVLIPALFLVSRSSTVIGARFALAVLRSAELLQGAVLVVVLAGLAQEDPVPAYDRGNAIGLLLFAGAVLAGLCGTEERVRSRVNAWDARPRRTDAGA